MVPSPRAYGATDAGFSRAHVLATACTDRLTVVVQSVDQGAQARVAPIPPCTARAPRCGGHWRRRRCRHVRGPGRGAAEASAGCDECHVAHHPGAHHPPSPHTQTCMHHCMHVLHAAAFTRMHGHKTTSCLNLNISRHTSMGQPYRNTSMREPTGNGGLACR